MSRFQLCFPSGDGNMVCQHHNGNWIVFPMRTQGGNGAAPENEKSSNEEDDSEE